MIIKKFFSETTFGDVPVGAIFHPIYEENMTEGFFLKTDHHDDWYGNIAVNLETGETSYPTAALKVALVECELRVKV